MSDIDDLCACGEPIKYGLCGGCGELPDGCECPDECPYCGLPNAECVCQKIANEAEPQQ